MKSLSEIVQDILENKEPSAQETEFLKKNLMNQDDLLLFSILLQKYPDKIPSTCVRYMKNPLSLRIFKKYTKDFKESFGHNIKLFNSLKRLKKGVFKNEFISDYDKATFAFFSPTSLYTIERFSKEILSNILIIQCENPTVNLIDRVISTASVGMNENKIEGNALSEFIHFLEESNTKDYLMDQFLSDFSISMTNLLPIMTAHSLASITKMSSNLYREYFNRNQNSFHHMVKTKIKRLENLDLKIRKSVSEELASRPDAGLTYVLI